MINQYKNRIVGLRVAIVLLFVLAGIGALFQSRMVTRTAGSNDDQRESTEPNETAPNGNADYSKFSHSVRQHKLECNSCHVFPSDNWKTVRAADEAIEDITDYPKHPSCLKCHRRQFFSGPKPTICRNCHTNPSPRNSSRHPFPNPREVFDLSAKGKRSFTKFDVYFPHEMHIAMMSENDNPIDDKDRLRDGRGYIARAGMKRSAQSDSCVMCHQTYLPQGDSDEEYVSTPPETLGDAFWLKKGSLKTLPMNHLTCFTCHSSDSGLSPGPSDCATCHKLKQKGITTDFDSKLAQTMGITDKIMLTSWRKRNSAATFRHEWVVHAEIDCTACHKTETMDTADPKNKTVAVTSCNECHITATTDDGGVLNFEIDSRKTDPKFQCTKCHLSYGGMPIPESHIKAITDLGGK